MQFYYLILPREIARKAGLTKYRREDANGNILVNQTDLSALQKNGESVQECAKRLNLTLLTRVEALSALSV